MLKKDAKFVSDPFAADIAKASNRDGYGYGVVKAGRENPDVVVLCADLTESTKCTGFREEFPDRFVQIGVQEQLLASCAAGMAAAGKVPFVASYAMFCPGRAWEQVRTNICLNGSNVKIIGSHGGVTVGEDGATHQGLEDIAIMRVLPNMTVIVPCDAVEAEKATVAISRTDGPCYMRLAREKTPVFTTVDTPFEIGRAVIFREGKDVAIIACGPLVYGALLAAEELAKEGVEAEVINCHTIKPIDEEALAAAAKKCGAVVTVEEHQIAGGLGGAVAEFLAQQRPVPVEFVGVRDRFGESGKAHELIEHFGMGVGHIKEAAEKAVKRKR